MNSDGSLLTAELTSNRHRSWCRELAFRVQADPEEVYGESVLLGLAQRDKLEPKFREGIRLGRKLLRRNVEELYQDTPQLSRRRPDHAHVSLVTVAKELGWSVPDWLQRDNLWTERHLLVPVEEDCKYCREVWDETCDHGAELRDTALRKFGFKEAWIKAVRNNAKIDDPSRYRARRQLRALNGLYVGMREPKARTLPPACIRELKAMPSYQQELFRLAWIELAPWKLVHEGAVAAGGKYTRDSAQKTARDLWQRMEALPPLNPESHEGPAPRSWRDPLQGLSEQL